MTTFARAHIREGTPPTHPQLSEFDLGRLIFRQMILDESDGHTIVENDHPDGYNMLILHPETKQIHWCYSHDFDFVTNEVTTNKTFEYHLFKMFQPRIYLKHLNEIIESIKANDLSYARPIMIDKNFTIHDGNTRFLAWIVLKKPIYYQICE